MYLAFPPYFKPFGGNRLKTMASFNPAQFIREVRQEMDKVTWPKRRETMISTLMVLALVTVASTFFVFIDWVISAVVRAIIGI